MGAAHLTTTASQNACRRRNTGTSAVPQTLLSEHGVFIEELHKQAGKDYDVFDLICHLAFDQPPLTRKERAENVKKQHYFAKYGDVARAALEALLDKYTREGIQNIKDIEVLKIPPFDTIGSTIEIVKSFGGRDEYLKAIKELEEIIALQ